MLKWSRHIERFWILRKVALNLKGIAFTQRFNTRLENDPPCSDMDYKLKNEWKHKINLGEPFCLCPSPVMGDLCLCFDNIQCTFDWVEGNRLLLKCWIQTLEGHSASDRAFWAIQLFFKWIIWSERWSF